LLASRVIATCYQLLEESQAQGICNKDLETATGVDPPVVNHRR